MMSEQKVTNYSVPVIFEPPCIYLTKSRHTQEGTALYSNHPSNIPGINYFSMSLCQIGRGRESAVRTVTRLRSG